jgi:hypothetical protein
MAGKFFDHSRQGCCLAMTLWLDYIVVAKPNYVQIFSSFRVSQHPRLIRTVPFGRYAWDVFIVSGSDVRSSMKGLFMPTSQAETDSTLNVLVTSEGEAYLYILFAATFKMNVYPKYFEGAEWPLRIRIGSSGSRMAWISGQHGINLDELPTLVACRLYRPTTPSSYSQGLSDGRTIGPEIEIGGPETEALPSLWALATFDIDEATGLLVVGNIFGELVLCDYVGSALENLAYIGDDFTEREAL